MVVLLQRNLLSGEQLLKLVSVELIEVSHEVLVFHLEQRLHLEVVVPSIELRTKIAHRKLVNK